MSILSISGSKMTGGEKPCPVTAYTQWKQRSLSSHLSFFTVLFALCLPSTWFAGPGSNPLKQESWAWPYLASGCSHCASSVSLFISPLTPELSPQVTLPRRAGQLLSSSPLCLGELNTVDVFHSGFVSLRGLYGLIPWMSLLYCGKVKLVQSNKEPD